MLKKAVSEVRFLSSVIILYGITLFLLWQGITPLWSNYRPSTSSQSQITMPHTQSRHLQILSSSSIKKGNPTNITIDVIGVDKPVLPGIYDSQTQSWNVSDIGVHFAELSSPVNDYGGNTLIYAHNNRLAFGRLYLIKPGDTVSISTDNNLIFTYSFVSADDFDPHSTDLFSSNGPPRLILQTCSGYFNEYRRLYSFKLDSVEKI